MKNVLTEHRPIIPGWKKLDLQVIHIKHNSLKDISPLRVSYKGNEFKDALPLETEKKFQKCQ